MALAAEAIESVKAAELTFEGGLERLESLVKRMEAQQLTLEDAMTAYADGMRLARALDDQLNQTEKRLITLSLDGGEDQRGESIEDAL
ncbi:MAG: exodeoxyribonuclease VII small subunit [Oscillospiraceae bacterium]|jgi:exodeoxyribonuclease VII small subunit|nr:exodeoxyribonuclease VII small subunit [Oscillospiraceae bacterium]